MDLPPETPSIETIPQSPAPERPNRRRRGGIHFGFLPLAFLAGLGVGYLIWSQPLAKIGADPAATPTGTANQQATRYDVPIDDDPVLGPQDAPVTLIIYSDYECPYCQKWYHEVFKQLLVAYPNQIRYVYKDFPLYGLHDLAAPAAEAANCAGEQGKYWEFQDKLFGMERDLGAETFTQYATDLGLEASKFAECVSSRRYKDEVEGDYQFAADLGISSTPTFFVNGLAVVGAQPIEVFQNVIDQELAAKK